MRQFFSWFPNGSTGAGLLLLRLGAAIWAAASGVSRLLHPQSNSPEPAVTGMAISLAAAALAAGFLTPAAALLAATWGVLAAALRLNADNSHFISQVASSLQVVLPACAIALLGPGAYSVDALLFGRRQIVIPSRSGRRSD